MFERNNKDLIYKWVGLKLRKNRGEKKQCNTKKVVCNWGPLDWSYWYVTEFFCEGSMQMVKELGEEI